jgi:tetratricopeptide (TPR) repeat protein
MRAGALHFPGRSGNRRERRVGACSVLTAAILSLAFVACATTGALPPQSSERWRELLAARGVRDRVVLELLTVTDDMVAVAREAAAGRSPRLQLVNLAGFLFDEDRFAFEHESAETLTARQAFERRRGNCVSSTILFIAMARSLGLPVNAALAVRDPEREQVEDLVVINRHLVATYRDPEGHAIFDFDIFREDAVLGFRAIDDRRLGSIHLSNRGVVRLLRGDTEGARSLLEDAVRLSPDFAEGYGNLGVAYRRSGETGAALDAYLLALRLDPSSRPVRNNLRTLFGLQSDAHDGDPRREYSRLLGAGDRKLSEGNARAAIRSYRRAARLEPSDVEPLLAIARAQLFRGRIRSARRVLESALEVEPGNEHCLRLLSGLEQQRPSASLPVISTN